MSQATIQVTVSICPECGGGLKINPVSLTYQCYHCGCRFKIIDQGKTEREFVCEKRVESVREKNIAKKIEPPQGA